MRDTRTPTLGPDGEDNEPEVGTETQPSHAEEGLAMVMAGGLLLWAAAATYRERRDDASMTRVLGAVFVVVTGLQLGCIGVVIVHSRG